MKKNTKSGVMAVEAAIFLPIFIISLLTLGYILKVVGIQQNVMHSISDEARLLAAESYVTKLDVLFPSKVKGRVTKENSRIEYLDCEKYRYLYKYKGYDSLISMRLSYSIKVNLPIGVYKSIPAMDTVVFRGFVGARTKNDPRTVREFEEEKEVRLVWVFPRAGEKYHKKECGYISNTPVETLLNRSVKGRYKSCNICDSKDLSIGNLVYCFPKSGEVYHRGNCYAVDKYVVDMDKEKAEEQGYAPCTKCGGI